MTITPKFKHRAYILGFCALFSFIVAAIALYDSIDTDLLWHIKLGEEIIKTGSISTLDTFSWQNGLHWIQYEWLYDVFIYLVINYTGMIGFVALFIISQFVLLVVGYYNHREYKLGWYLLLVSLLMLVIPRNMFNRPAEFSIWAIVFVAWLYQKDIKYKRIIMLLLGVLLANFHGGVIITIIPCWVLLELFDLYFDKREGLKLDIHKFIVNNECLVMLLIGSLLNPSGSKLISTSLAVASAKSTDYIQEWKPTNFNYVSAFIFMLVIIAFGYRLKQINFERKETSMIALICAFGVLGLTSQKAFIMFTYLFIIFEYKALGELVDAVFTSNKAFKVLQTVGPSILVLIIFATFTQLGLKISFDEFVSEHVSMDIVNELKENNGSRVIHSYGFGNYLVWNDVKCFVDTRQSPFISETSNNSSLDDLIRAGGIPERNEVDNLFETYDPEYIVTDDMLNIKWYIEELDNWELIVDDVEFNQQLWKRWDK